MKTALLIVDVQRGLFESMPPPHEAVAVLERINLLSSTARQAGVPVVFAQHERDGSPLQYGAEKWELDKRLVIEARDVVLRKTTPDVFLRSDLLAHLAAWGTEELVICGYATEICVDTTARRASALGFAVRLVSDAHTTHDRQHATATQIRIHHNATLPSVGVVFGVPIRVVPTDRVTYEAAEPVSEPETPSK
jgi:nicotinamidase-related amidase